VNLEEHGFDELRDLCNSLHEGRLDETGAARLQELVRSDSEAAWFYVRHAQLQAGLEYDARALSLDLQAQGVLPAALTKLEPSPETAARSTWISRGVPAAWLSLTAVAAAVAAAIWFAALIRNDNLSPQVTVARLTREIDCHWQDGAQRASGSELRVGERLHLLQGMAELTMVDGAQLKLQGPTIIELASAKQVVVHAGRVSAVVPEQAIGFTVLAKGLKVVDLGTEFGLQVDESGRTEVHVFDGAVELESSVVALPRTRLEESQALSIDAVRGVVEELRADTASFSPGTGGQEPPRHLAIQEEFAASQLDAARWTVRLPFSKSVVQTIAGGELLLRDRGYLTTVQKFDPVKTGGVRITAFCRFSRSAADLDDFDVLDILTRSNGELDPRPDKFKQAAEGIRFRISTRRSRPVVESAGPNLLLSESVSFGELRIKAEVEYRLEIIDDGRNVSCSICETGDPSRRATAVAVVLRDDSDANQIVIHNRHGTAELRLGKLEIATGTPLRLP